MRLDISEGVSWKKAAWAERRYASSHSPLGLWAVHGVGAWASGHCLFGAWPLVASSPGASFDRSCRALLDSHAQARSPRRTQVPHHPRPPRQHSNPAQGAPTHQYPSFPHAQPTR